MSINITYLDREGKIQFDCPSNECPVRDRLIDNLNRAHIDFHNNGGIFWVAQDQFTSTDDIAERALGGFSEIEDFKPHEHYDNEGIQMTFIYLSMTPSSAEENARSHGGADNEAEELVRQVDDNLRENSKTLLDEHYNSLRPSMG